MTLQSTSLQRCFNFVFVKRQNNLPLPKVLRVSVTDRTNLSPVTSQSYNATQLQNAAWNRMLMQWFVIYLRYVHADPPNGIRLKCCSYHKWSQHLSQNFISLFSVSPRKDESVSTKELQFRKHCACGLHYALLLRATS